jgi:hypothetical protein
MSMAKRAAAPQLLRERGPRLRANQREIVVRLDRELIEKIDAACIHGEYSRPCLAGRLLAEALGGRTLYGVEFPTAAPTTPEVLSLRQE